MLKTLCFRQLKMSRYTEISKLVHSGNIIFLMEQAHLSTKITVKYIIQQVMNKVLPARIYQCNLYNSVFNDSFSSYAFKEKFQWG